MGTKKGTKKSSKLSVKELESAKTLIKPRK